MKRFAHLADLQPLVGHELGVSDWITVDQGRIDLFAQATGDHQWIHVDVERANAGPFGAPVAHGDARPGVARGLLEAPVDPRRRHRRVRHQDQDVGRGRGVGHGGFVSMRVCREGR